MIKMKAKRPWKRNLGVHQQSALHRSRTRLITAKSARVAHPAVHQAVASKSGDYGLGGRMSITRILRKVQWLSVLESSLSGESEKVTRRARQRFYIDVKCGKWFIEFNVYQSPYWESATGSSI